MANGDDLPDITESPPDEERLRLLASVAEDAADYLGVSLDEDSPEAIIRAVHECVREIQEGGGPEFDEGERVDLLLGCLWGSQLVRALGWEWVNVVFHDHGDSEAVGVASPNREFAIYPFHFVQGCLENNATVKILLAYNMLSAGAMPTLPPRSYENVMDAVHYIIPPD